VKISHIITLPAIIISLCIISGCGGGTGTLADYFGWQSLGGKWHGELHLSDGRDLPLAMTFTRFDGSSFHVVVEADEGPDYIRNESDADYIAATKYFTFDLLPFFGGPCHVTGSIKDTYNISGNMYINLGGSSLDGYYDIAYTP
jgi:hypothetical protein